jgi:hypothetical protein
MQSKDLRIGNLVKGNSRGGTHILDIEVLKYIDETKSGYSPLPLTEEMLIDLGFSKMTDTTPYNYRIHKSKMFFYIRYGTFTTDKGKTDLIGFNGLFIANKFVRVIKYVHELQNLYFALTGEELDLKHESKP